MAEPAISVNFTARMLGAETCAVGNGLVYDTAASGFRVATAATRASAMVRTQAIAMTANGSALVGSVQYQMSGLLAKEISLLPALTPSTTTKLVRMSSTGFIERVDTYTTGDDLVGVAYWDGRVQLMIGFPLDMIIALAVAAVPVPETSASMFRPTDAMLVVGTSYNGAQDVTTGVQFAIAGDEGKLCYGVRTVIRNPAPVTMRGRLYVAGGSTVADANADLAVGTVVGLEQRISILFPTPVALDAGTIYIASTYEVGTGGYTQSNGSGGYDARCPNAPFFTGEAGVIIIAMNMYHAGDVQPTSTDATERYLIEPIMTPQ